MFGVDQSQFNHQLAAVADTEREGVFAGVEVVEGRLGLGIEQEGTGPPLGGTQYVGVGETAAEGNDIDILQGLTTADKVGHRDIFHIEAGQPEGIGHFAFGVGSLLTDDGGTQSAGFATVGIEAVLRQLAGEFRSEGQFQRLLLVVLETLAGTAVEALLAVEQVGRRIPYVAQVVDAELIGGTVLADQDVAFFAGDTQLDIADTGIFEDFLHFRSVLVGYLDDDTRIFGEEGLHDVVFLQLVEIDLHTAFRVGKAHFEQGRDETTGRNVVTGQEETLMDQFLNSEERIAEIFRILDGRYVAAYLIQGLCEGRTAQLQGVEREVDVVEAALRVVLHDGADNLADIAHLAAGADDDGSRADDFLAAGVFLGHGQGVLAGGYVDLQFAAEIGEGFHGGVETGIFTFLRAARPHPVG